MYGKTMGSLAIKMDLSNGKSWFILYKNGNQGIHWKKGTGNIDVPLGVSYRLTIQGKIGQPGYSDIAIDDVYIDPGLCSCQDEFHTCHIWAAKGECTANEVWMKQNCKRSCNVCRGKLRKLHLKMCFPEYRVHLNQTRFLIQQSDDIKNVPLSSWFGLRPRK